MGEIFAAHRLPELLCAQEFGLSSAPLLGIISSLGSAEWAAGTSGRRTRDGPVLAMPDGLAGHGEQSES